MAQAKTVSGEGGEGIVQKAKGFVLLVVGGQTQKVSTRGARALLSVATTSECNECVI